jgi:hypothetical protein
VVKTEPPNSNGDEPMHSYRKIVNTFLWSPELLTYFPYNFLWRLGRGNRSRDTFQQINCTSWPWIWSLAKDGRPEENAPASRCTPLIFAGW